MTGACEQVVKRVEKAHADAAAHLGRGDTKASALLPLFGGFLAGAVALTSRPMPGWAEVTMWGSVALALVAMVALLTVVRPWLGRDDRYGVVFLAGFEGKPDAALTVLVEQEQQPAPEEQVVDSVRLSARAVWKYRRVRFAVNCLIGAAVLLAAALAGIAGS